MALYKCIIIIIIIIIIIKYPAYYETAHTARDACLYNISCK